MYKYISYKKINRDDIWYQNGNNGQIGYITKASEAECRKQGVYTVLEIPKWVRKELGL